MVLGGAGVNVSDVDVVYQHSRYTTCISPTLGGSGNPSVPTAAGVVEAMEVRADTMAGCDAITVMGLNAGLKPVM